LRSSTSPVSGSISNSQICTPVRKVLLLGGIGGARNEPGFHAVRQVLRVPRLGGECRSASRFGRCRRSRRRRRQIRDRPPPLRACARRWSWPCRRSSRSPA
jgi:hypothetical protein